MFIAEEFSLPYPPASCREVMPAPLVEDVQRPRPRPRSLAFEKSGPNAADALSSKLRRQRWRDVGEAGFHFWPQRPAKPYFPRQRKCFFPLTKNFFRQQSA